MADLLFVSMRRVLRLCGLDGASVWSVGFQFHGSSSCRRETGMSEIRAVGYAGGYAVGTDFLREVRPPRQAQFERRFETSPGPQAQVDFAEFAVTFTDEPDAPRKVSLFSIVLGQPLDRIHLLQPRRVTIQQNPWAVGDLGVFCAYGASSTHEA